MTQNSTSPPVGERRLSILILGLLILIVVVLALQQSRFDPVHWRERAVSEEAHQQSPQEGRLPANDTVEGLNPMSAPERYDADTLSDKINGKAELYLSAGFQQLETRRFSVSGDPDAWMERFVYDMGARRNAFAVYSAQRRMDAAHLDMVAHGYLSSNGLFFIHGSFYVEIIAAQAGEPIQDKMKALAAHFVAAHDSSGVDIVELGFFPPEHQVPASAVLIADSAFGLQGLDWVFTAAYENGSAQATAFIAPCGSADEARSLAAAFSAFWTEYGGEMVTPPAELKDAEVVTILDNFEIVLVQGRYLVGVHEATHLDFGADVTARLRQMVMEKAP